MHLKSIFVKRRSRPMEEHGPKELWDQVGDMIRLRHYAYRAGQAHAGWMKG